MFKQTIEKLLLQEDLSAEESRSAAHEILGGANAYQTAAFLMLMRAKGETVDELFGVIEGMRNLMVRVPVHCPVLDIVGTGGDRFGTVKAYQDNLLHEAETRGFVTTLLERLRYIPELTSKIYNVLASGRPCIAAVEQDSEVADIINRHDCGFAIAPGDASALEARTLDLAGDRERAVAMGARARGAALQFDRPRQVAAYDALLREVASRC